VKQEHFINPSGRLIQETTPDGIQYWAFVPDPLPPAIEPTMKLMSLLSEADRALGQLAGLGSNVSNPHLFIRPFINREAVLSSRIEGTRTDIADLYAYQAQLTLPGMDAPPADDTQEVVNYITALEYGIQRLDTLPISKRFMRELHGQLMQGVRGQEKRPGEFRATQNYIAGLGLSVQDARFVPPPPMHMQQALDDLERYIHHDAPDIPPLMKIALVHYQFEAIHPFEDGNGRIGRLLIPLLLVHWQLLPAPLLYLSAYFEQDREQYNDLMLAVSERSAWNEWLLFFLQGVTEQARDATIRAQKLQALEKRWREELRTKHPAANVVRLMESLFIAPIISVPQAQKILGVSYTAANKNVSYLVEAGILEKVGDAAYDRLFVSRQILDVLTFRDTN
jgi:Fic family protein